MFRHYLIESGLMTGNINLAHDGQYDIYTEVTVKLSNLIQMVKWATFYPSAFQHGINRTLIMAWPAVWLS